MVKRSQLLQYSFPSTHLNLAVIHPSEGLHSDGWEDLLQADSGDVLLRDADLLRAEGLLNRLVRGHVRVPQILGELAEVIDVIVVLPHLPRVEMH